jgi:hypothetical protein
LVSFILRKVEIAVNASAEAVMRIEGTTSVGAYLNIWNIYIKDISDVSPVRVNTEKIEEQNAFIYCDLVESSPALYCLKKLTGKESILDIVAASTAIPVCVAIRAFNRFFTLENSTVLTLTQIEKSAIETRSLMLPLSRTSEKSIFVISGESIPTSVVTSAAKISITLLEIGIQSKMYTESAPIPSFLFGKGL